jgi:hypothetical protein
MQLLSLNSQFKHIEVRFNELEGFKVQDMVVQYVNSQLELLNIPQMKIDFYDFYDRMKKVEARMNEKMK